MSILIKVENRELGLLLHNWHDGMDSVYAAGSTIFADGTVDSETLEDCLWILEKIARKDNRGLADEDMSELFDLIEEIKGILKAAGVETD